MILYAGAPVFTTPISYTVGNVDGTTVLKNVVLKIEQELNGV